MSLAKKTVAPGGRIAPGGSKGFTLIELLVVIGIIVLLIGILIPALSGARTQAQRASTEATMNAIASNVHQYAAKFNGSIPGLMPATGGANYSVGGGAPGNGKISGIQNLVLSMSYSLGGGLVVLPGGGGTVDVASPNGPTDNSVSPAAGMPSFQSLTPNDMKTASMSITTASYKWNGFPVIVDKFRDPLPILYFRVDQPSGAWAAENTSSSASYYRQENSEYLDYTVTSINGTTFDQTGASGGRYSSGNNGVNNLGSDIQAAQGGGSSSPFSTRGDFVLIAAGPNRLYGGKANGTTNDGIVKVFSVK